MHGLSEIKKLNAKPASNPAGDERSNRAGGNDDNAAQKAAWLKLADEAEAAGDLKVAKARREQAASL